MASTAKGTAPKATGLWVACEGPALYKRGCSSKYTSAAVVVEGTTRHVCGSCAKAAKVKRVSLIVGTDRVAERTGMAEGKQLAAVTVGSHKGLYANTLEGGSPDKVTAAITRKRGSGQAASVKTTRVAKPKAKTA